MPVYLATLDLHAVLRALRCSYVTRLSRRHAISAFHVDAVAVAAESGHRWSLVLLQTVKSTIQWSVIVVVRQMW